MTTEEFIEFLREKANKNQRTRPSHEEDDLQMKCYDWYAKTYSDKYPKLLHHSVNEGRLRGGEKEGARRKKMGMQSGFPDFIFVLPPTIFIELKTKKGKQSDGQKDFQKSVESVGLKYYLVRTEEEFRNIITKHIEEYER